MSIPSNLPTPDNYPQAPGPIAEIFGFNKPKDHGHGDAPGHGAEVHTEAHKDDAEHGPETAHFPIKGIHSAEADVPHLKTTQAHAVPTTEPAVKEGLRSHGAHDSHEPTPSMPTSVKVAALRKIVTVIAPYVAIFAIGLFTYFYFFNKVDFGSIFKSAAKPAPVASKKDTQMQSLIAQNRAAYDKWIAGFYYDVSDPGVLDPNADNSGNGLSNFQKFLLNLNPKSYSTLGLDRSDTELLAEGISPLSGSPLTDKQKDIVSKYIDLEIAMNKLAATRSQRQGQVAGTSTIESNQGIQPRGSLNGPLNMNIPTTQASAVPAINPYALDIDQNIPGRLEIKALGIDVPLIWTQDPKNFDEDLKNGVVHYPGTAFPGEIGTAYVSGHSSNYAWAKGSYNNIFANIDELPDYASFQVTVTLKNGKQAVAHYVVKNRKEFKATDQEQFLNGGTSVVALSTCWPVGSTAKRYVVFGELTQVDR